MSLKSRIDYGTYIPPNFEDIVTYVWDSKDNSKTGAYFRILSEAHANTMALLHPNLAPAIQKTPNQRKGYGNWQLVGITQESTRRDVFGAMLLVNNK